MGKKQNLGYDGTTNEQQIKNEQENFIEKSTDGKKEIFTQQKQMRANRFALSGSVKAAIAVLVGLGLLGGMATLFQFFGL